MYEKHQNRSFPRPHEERISSRVFRSLLGLAKHVLYQTQTKSEPQGQENEPNLSSPHFTCLPVSTWATV